MAIKKLTKRHLGLLRKNERNGGGLSFPEIIELQEIKQFLKTI